MDLASHQQLLTAVATRMVGRDDADDIVQETFLRALARQPDDRGGSLAPWLVTVARNLAIDLMRQRGRQADLQDDEAEIAAPPPAQSLASLLAGLGALSPGEVAVLLLRDVLDLDVDEVATALDTSEGSVRVLHHRARRKAAEQAPLDQGLRALDRFLTWLLGRAVAGLPWVGARPQDPGLGQGVLTSHLHLLGAMIEVAHAAGDRGVEGRARLSRGTARLAMGRPDAADDLEAAIALGADPCLAETRLAPLLYTRGDSERALAVALSALDRGGHPHLHGRLHRLASSIYLARGDAQAAEPHLAALRRLGEEEGQAAYAAFARAGLAMAAERFGEACAELLVALAGARAAGNSRNECTILNNLCFATLSAGDLEDAAAWGAEGLALAHRLGDAKRTASLSGNLATIHHLSGRLDLAAVDYGRAIQLCDASKMYFEAELLRCHLAVVDQLRGHPAAAEAALRGIVGRLEHLPGLSLAPRIQLAAAQAELGTLPPGALEELMAEARQVPSLVAALRLYGALAGGDRATLAEVLALPVGTAPAERVAHAIVSRVSSGRPTGPPTGRPTISNRTRAGR